MLSFNEVSSIMWTLCAVSILLTVGRYWIRYNVRHRFYADDAAHLNALIWLVVNLALVQVTFPVATIVLEGPPDVPPPPSAISEFRKLQTATGISFYISHWSVKLSFMFFYRQLFWVSTQFRKAWWTIGSIVFIGFWVVLAGALTQCGAARDLYNPEACAAHKAYQRDARIYIFSMNIGTDLMVMILPLFMLPQLHIKLSQKLGLGLIFSICLVTIALEILRFAESITPGLIANTVIFGVLSANFAVIVSCIPTYRTLLGVRRRTKDGQYAYWGKSERTPPASHKTVGSEPSIRPSGSAPHSDRGSEKEAEVV